MTEPSKEEAGGKYLGLEGGGQGLYLGSHCWPAVDLRLITVSLDQMSSKSPHLQHTVIRITCSLFLTAQLPTQIPRTTGIDLLNPLCSFLLVFVALELVLRRRGNRRKSMILKRKRKERKEKYSIS